MPAGVETISPIDMLLQLNRRKIGGGRICGRLVGRLDEVRTV